MKPLLFIDSGAYSAQTKGAKIELAAYVNFLKRWGKYIDVAASLDVLRSPEESWANQQAMEALGVKPLPCFHLGEDPKWLVRYVERYDYIALGGLVGTSPSQQAMWLDDIWTNYLTNFTGEAIVKVHAFGVTSPLVMQRYPWFSVDSTSWLLQAAMGRIQIMVRDPSTGVLEFASIAVSDKSDDAGHIDALPDGVRAGVLKRLGEFDIAELQADYKKRFSFNADEYAKMAALIPWKPYQSNYRSGLFDEPCGRDLAEGVPPWDHLTLYLAGNPGSQGTTREVMQKGYHRLMSYHYIKEAEKNFAEAREVLDGFNQAK